MVLKGETHHAAASLSDPAERPSEKRTKTTDNIFKLYSQSFVNDCGHDPSW